MLSSSDKPFRCFTWILVLLLFLGGTFLIAGAFIPYDLVKSKLDAFAASGDASIFSESWYHIISGRLKLFGGAALLGAILLYLARKRINIYFRDVIISAKLLSGKLKQRSLKLAFQRERVHYVTLLLLLLLGFLVRLYYLKVPLKFDEAGSFLCNALRPALAAASFYATPNNHILHSLLMRCAYLIFGGAPWAFRLPAFISGVLIIPASYAVVRRLVNANAALIAAGLAASSSILVEYSVNARGYTLMVFLFLCVLYVASHLQKSNNRFLWVLLALFAALGLYTVPVMLYPLSIVFCWLFFSIVLEKDNPRRFSRLKELFGSLLLIALITFILYLPVLILSGWEALAANPYVLPRSWVALSRLWPNTVLAVVCQLMRDIPTALQLILAAAALVSVIFYRKLNLLLLSAVIAPLPLLLIQRAASPPRTWIFWAFFFFIAVAAGLDYLLEQSRIKNLRYKGPVCAIIVVALSAMLTIQLLGSKEIYYSNETGSLRDAPAIVETVAPLLQEGDCILATAPSDAILEYYLREKGLSSSYLWDVSYHCKRVFVVVNESYSQVLYELLKVWGLAEGDYHPPEIRGIYEEATLYELNRIW